jgi:hypothetical protein
LNDLSLEYSGIYEDGWLSRDSYVVLPSGAHRLLTIRGDALPLPNQRVELLMDGKRLASKIVRDGPLDWEVRLPSSQHRRRVELRWAATGRISSADPRRAAARLSFLGFTEPLSALAHFPVDLRRGVAYAGIYDDGWLARVSRATLVGGRAGHLVIRADVPERKGQRLLVRVDGRGVATRTAPKGVLNLRVPIPASATPRTIELVWSRTAKLAAPDTRYAAARLKLLQVEQD